jgi:hypothetical protein
MSSDLVTARLVKERRELLRELGETMTLVGGWHPNRSKVNKARRLKRRELKQKLLDNATALCARQLHLYPETPT